MRAPVRNSRKKWYVGGAAGLAAVVGGYFVWGALASGDESDRLLAEIRSTPPEQRFEQMRELRAQTESLTEEERHKVFEGMREMFEEEMSKRVDEYLDAPEDQKQEILDRHIDEMIAWRERRRAERENDPNRTDRREGDGASGRSGGPQAGGEGAGPGGRAGGPPGDAVAGGNRRGPWGPRSIQERKERMEGRNPDHQARMMQYRMKMVERAKERGIDMGRGPGGGPGGRRGGT